MNATATATPDTDTPRVWRACLACYNDGRLIGAWIDAADSDAITAWDEAHEARTGHEEFAIHDYDGMIDLGEYPSLDDLAAWAEIVDQNDYATVKAFVEYLGADYAEPDGFAEAYRGTFDSIEAFAEQLADDIDLFHGTPEDSVLRRYFDFEAFARDLFMGDYYAADVPGGVAVFDCNP